MPPQVEEKLKEDALTAWHGTKVEGGLKTAIAGLADITKSFFSATRVCL